MSENNQPTITPVSYERAISDMKQGASAVVAAQTQASERFSKASKEVAALNQGTFQAFVQAGQIYAAGAQNIAQQMAESSRHGFAEMLNSVRAILAAKSAKERIELQSNFLRTSALWSVSEASRFAQAGIELAEKVAAPLQARVVEAAELISAQQH